MFFWDSKKQLLYKNIIIIYLRIVLSICLRKTFSIENTAHYPSPLLSILLQNRLGIGFFPELFTGNSSAEQSTMLDPDVQVQLPWRYLNPDPYRLQSISVLDGIGSTEETGGLSFSRPADQAEPYILFWTFRSFPIQGAAYYFIFTVVNVGGRTAVCANTFVSGCVNYVPPTGNNNIVRIVIITCSVFGAAGADYSLVNDLGCWTEVVWRLRVLCRYKQISRREM